MASQTFKPRQPIALADHAADVARRQAEFGPVNPPRNAGNRRTESKRALLKAIDELGGKW